MWGYLIIAFIVLLAAVVAVVLIARAQARRLRKELRVEITNRGNARSRYELKASDPEEALQFQFKLDGDPLPPRQLAAEDEVAPARDDQPAPAPAPAGAGGVGKKAGQAMGLANRAAQGIDSVASFLPEGIRAPLDRVTIRLRRGQVKVQRAQQTTARVQSVKSKASAKAKPKSKTETGTRRQPVLPGAVETPFIRPGETLILDLWIRAARPATIRNHPFTVRSRSVEREDAPWLAEEDRIQILAASSLSRYLPYVIVFAVTAAMLALVVWLASAGALS